MTTIETKFTNNDDAVKWAEENGHTVIMSALLETGLVTLTVI